MESGILFGSRICGCCNKVNEKPVICGSFVITKPNESLSALIKQLQLRYVRNDGNEVRLMTHELYSGQDFWCVSTAQELLYK